MRAIYAIHHIPTSRRYIGSSVSYRSRRGNHKGMLRGNYHHSRRLQDAWNEFGEDEFEFYVVEEVAGSNALLEREQFWIDFFDSAGCGFNMLPKAGDVPTWGIKYRDKSRSKPRPSRIGIIRKLEREKQRGVLQEARSRTKKREQKRDAKAQARLKLNPRAKVCKLVTQIAKENAKKWSRDEM